MNTSNNNKDNNEEMTEYYGEFRNNYTNPMYYCPLCNSSYINPTMNEDDDSNEFENLDSQYRKHGGKKRRRRRRRRRYPVVFPIIIPFRGYYDGWEYY